MMTRNAFTTHKNGSWKWQKRYALVQYVPHRTRDGRWIWRTSEELNGKIKHYTVAGHHVGSLHNIELTPGEVFLLALGVEYHQSATGRVS